MVRATAVSEAGHETASDAADVVVAIKVVSPESEERDGKRKPQLYAEAGIAHFWRVEQGEGRRPVVYAYELDRMTSRYVPVGMFHDQLKLVVPFSIDIDLTEIDRMYCGARGWRIWIRHSRAALSAMCSSSRSSPSPRSRPVNCSILPSR